jgi:hypothetical protein
MVRGGMTIAGPQALSRRRDLIYCCIQWICTRYIQITLALRLVYFSEQKKKSFFQQTHQMFFFLSSCVFNVLINHPRPTETLHSRTVVE